jgi:heat shock protein HslJ
MDRLVITIGAIMLLAMGCQRTARSTSDTAAIDAAGFRTRLELIGPNWTLVDLFDKPAPPGAGGRAPTLVIEGGAEPRASGFAGCNRWSSGYTLGGPERIQFTAPASTKMACASGMEVEQQFLAMLTATRAYVLFDSNLVLQNEFGKAHARLVPR